MRINPGSTVTLQYVLMDEGGQVLSESSEPLTFTIGDPEVLPAFQEALMGLSAGETHTFTLSPEEAFGPYREELVFRVPRAQLQGLSEEGVEELRVGDVLQLYTSSAPEAEPILAYVTQVDAESVELDANHPLAGKALKYQVTILEVV